MNPSDQERVSTIVIGGGQAGLSAGFHLAQRGLPFLILDANRRVGDAWRNRWDSLRLFTPARFDGLDGMPFPAGTHDFPTKDEMADYLEAYARTFELPVRTGKRVERLGRGDGMFVVDAGGERLVAENVVVAMSSWQQPRIPEAAEELDAAICQLHSSEYRNPGQLGLGDVLVVGVGNSGAEIALDLVGDRRVLLAGREIGHVPFRIESRVGRRLAPVMRFLFHRVLTTSTPIGRKARPHIIRHGEPLVRTKPKDLTAAGVERVPRVVGARDGLPLLEDDRVVDVGNVVWATGYEPGFSWIDLPVFEEDGQVAHERGLVPAIPGLYFVGLKFLYSASSAQINGVGRDAARVADHIARRGASTTGAATSLRSPG